HAGGGIVWDSEPLLEWEESETKSREFFRALAAAAGDGER
ncbi:MAG: chorismate-binding protein, partial [Deltaproteobacteria bacterium]|nr:chorismate-binding protein [Deltaproteobacteria bacterium]